jgi:hypothetical protein
MASRKQIISNAVKAKSGKRVSGNSQAALGTQLSNKVASGGLSQSQALQTAKQRQTFKAAFGSDWRTQVYGKGGAKGLSGPFGARQIAAKRSQALKRARTKLG